MNDPFNSAILAFSTMKITSNNDPIAIVKDLDAGKIYEVFDSVGQFHKDSPCIKNASVIWCNQAGNQ